MLLLNNNRSVIAVKRLVSDRLWLANHRRAVNNNVIDILKFVVVDLLKLNRIVNYIAVFLQNKRTLSSSGFSLYLEFSVYLLD